MRHLRRLASLLKFSKMLRSSRPRDSLLTREAPDSLCRLLLLTKLLWRLAASAPLPTSGRPAPAPVGLLLLAALGLAAESCTPFAAAAPSCRHLPRYQSQAYQQDLYGVTQLLVVQQAWSFLCEAPKKHRQFRACFSHPSTLVVSRIIDSCVVLCYAAGQDLVGQVVLPER